MIIQSKVRKLYNGGVKVQMLEMAVHDKASSLLLATIFIHFEISVIKLLLPYSAFRSLLDEFEPEFLVPFLNT